MTLQLAMVGIVVSDMAATLEFYLGTREAVDTKHVELVGLGYVSRHEPWKSAGPYAAIIEDPDGTPILITAEDPSAEL
jgi:hypothetical protein